MNCDCISKWEAKLSDYMKPRAGDDAKATISNTAFALIDSEDGKSSALIYRLTIPFRIKGSKKGYTSERGKEMPFTAAFCPFCGRTTGRYQVGEYAALETQSAAPSEQEKS